MTDLETYCEKVVAQHVAAEALDDLFHMWDIYDEMGEFTWENVTDLARGMVPFPSNREFAAAYAYLSALAENEES